MSTKPKYVRLRSKTESYEKPKVKLRIARCGHKSVNYYRCDLCPYRGAAIDEDFIYHTDAEEQDDVA